MKKRPNFIEDAHRIYTAKGSKAFQGFEVNETLYQEKSKYQEIAIYTNDTLGTILVLDGVVQITTLDEFIYQEMMTHVPMLSHSNPKNVLIVGGGDGGILREVLRHKSVEVVVMAEIDQMVIKACIDHMPTINNAGKIYDDGRVELVVGDAARYIENTSHRFDAVIIDSTDPIGPGESLFSNEFYIKLSKVLSDEAFLVTQGGVPIFQKGEMASSLGSLSHAGLSTDCYIAAVPTYYGGYMAFGFASNVSKSAHPQIHVLKQRFERADLITRHYNPEIHLASFVLPQWIAEEVAIQDNGNVGAV